jgi:hypothetical protein
MSAFSAAGRAKNARASASSRAMWSGSTPWPTMAKNPTSRHAASTAIATADGSSTPVTNGEMSISGTTTLPG